MTLPIVELLETAASEAEQARHCLKMPDDIISRDWLEIDRILSASACATIQCYAHARHVACHSVRSIEGELPPYVKDRLEQLREATVAIARGEA